MHSYNKLKLIDYNEDSYIDIIFINSKKNQISFFINPYVNNFFLIFKKKFEFFF